MHNKGTHELHIPTKCLALFTILLAPCVLRADEGAIQIHVKTPSRKIVMDAGAGGYQAFPDICRTKNGDLFCVFYAGYGHISQPNSSLPKGGQICAVRSSDEGKTWSAPKTIIDTPKDDRDPSVMCLPNGVLVCNFFVYGLYGECDTNVSRSNDNGLTWSNPVVAAPSFATSSPIRRLRNGRLLLPVYNVDGNNKRAYAGVCISDNSGKTWGRVHPIGQDAGQTLDETDFFERKDGSIVAVMRETMSSAISTDHGNSWSEVTDLGFKGHCPYLLMSKNGILLMAHRLPQTSLHWSRDEGRTWHGPILIDNFIGAYPSMINLKDGTILCVFYEEGAKSAIRAVNIQVVTKQ